MVNVQKPSVQKPRLEPAQLVDTAMRAHFLVLRVQGWTGAAQTAEEFYGFSARDVIEMHVEKKGVGRGLWFRLKDGRMMYAAGAHAYRVRSLSSAPKKRRA